ncbi:MAG: hypothetical protein SGCHY_003322 [Lobulomycetales sp.]
MLFPAQQQTYVAPVQRIRTRPRPDDVKVRQMAQQLSLETDKRRGKRIHAQLQSRKSFEKSLHDFLTPSKHISVDAKTRELLPMEAPRGCTHSSETTTTGYADTYRSRRLRGGTGVVDAKKPSNTAVSTVRASRSLLQQVAEAEFTCPPYSKEGKSAEQNRANADYYYEQLNGTGRRLKTARAAHVEIHTNDTATSAYILDRQTPMFKPESTTKMLANDSMIIPALTYGEEKSANDDLIEIDGYVIVDGRHISIYPPAYINSLEDEDDLLLQDESHVFGNSRRRQKYPPSTNHPSHDIDQQSDTNSQSTVRNGSNNRIGGSSKSSFGLSNGSSNLLNSASEKLSNSLAAATTPSLVSAKAKLKRAAKMKIASKAILAAKTMSERPATIDG